MKKFIPVFTFIVLVSLVSPVFAAKPTPTPVPTVKSVCIDPGHGGTDTGAVNGDLYEKNVNLNVALFLKAKLETVGYTVFMTRDADIALSNADRYNYCNEQKATILISIHHNGSTDSNMDYSQALYMKKADVALAQKVVNAVSTSLTLTNKGISRFASGVLLKSKMPATISEGFFLTNENEYNLINTSNRLEDESEALFTAIQSYFN